jgi:uncharacterized hydrophobic protein (TIGR00271 family)
MFWRRLAHRAGRRLSMGPPPAEGGRRPPQNTTDSHSETLCIELVLLSLLERFSLERDKDDPQAILSAIERDVSFRGINLWVLIAAVVIASVGLNVNSTAVIIGAMLISPLMGPIVGIGVSLATYNLPLLNKSLRNFLLAVFFNIFTSALYFWVSPLKEAGSELIARTSPSVWDVVIAFFGGLAGIIAAASREEKITVIAGVAIATALMPPLCTVGYEITSLQPQFIAGAFYLFSINAVLISTAAYLIAQLLRFPKVEIANAQLRLRIRRLALLVVIGTFLPTLYLSWRLVQKAIQEKRLRLFLQHELRYAQTSLISYKLASQDNKTILEIVLIGEGLSEKDQERLRRALSNYKLPIDSIQIIQGATSPTSLRTSTPAEAPYQRLYTEIQHLTDSLRLLKEHLRTYQMQDTLPQTLLREIRIFFPTIEGIGIIKLTPSDTSRKPLYVVCIQHQGALPKSHIQA